MLLSLRRISVGLLLLLAGASAANASTVVLDEVGSFAGLGSIPMTSSRR